MYFHQTNTFIPPESSTFIRGSFRPNPTQTGQEERPERTGNEERRWTFVFVVDYNVQWEK